MTMEQRRDLANLASQLDSEHDRQQYTKVISMAERLQSRIQELQRLKSLPSSPSSSSDTGSSNNSRSTAAAASGMVVAGSTPPEATDDTNNKQQLDRYYRLLERSQSIQKELNRISTEYSLPQPSPPPPPPQHPPPSFPPPPLPPPQPPAKTFLLDVRLPSTPPPTPKKDNEEQQDDPIITPPASPRMKQVRFHQEDHDDDHDLEEQEPPLPPLPPPQARKELPPITHVQKRINGLRGFLTRTYQLSNDLVMSRAHITPLRLFTATEIMTGKPKAVLKIVITAHHDYGFSFYWPSAAAASINGTTTTTTVMPKPNRAQDVAKFALVPDALVQDALDGWIRQQGGVLPPLYQATHILRESIKIYVVYNRYLFNNL